MDELRDELRTIKATLRILEEEMVSYRAEMGETRAEIGKYADNLENFDIDMMVQRVAKKVMNEFYQEVGKTVVKRALAVTGIVCFIIMCWLTGSGKFRIWGNQ